MSILCRNHLKSALRDTALILSFFLTASCASPGQDFKLQRQVDRPPVLSQDHASWRFIYQQSFENDRNPSIYPFYWEQGLTERLTLVWTPLPLEFRYLFYSAENPENNHKQWFYLTTTLLGSPYSRQKQFSWRPSVQASWKQQIHSQIAWSEEALFHLEFNRVTRPDQSSGVSIGNTLGAHSSLIFQIGQKVSFSPGFWLLRETGETRARYLGTLPKDLSHSPRWRVPLTLDGSWMIFPTTELQATLEIDRLGYANDFHGSSFYLSFIYYW